MWAVCPQVGVWPRIDMLYVYHIKYRRCTPQQTSSLCLHMCCVLRCRCCQHGQTHLHGRWSGGGIQCCSGTAHLHGSQCCLLWTGWHWTGKDMPTRTHTIGNLKANSWHYDSYPNGWWNINMLLNLCLCSKIGCSFSFGEDGQVWAPGNGYWLNNLVYVGILASLKLKGKGTWTGLGLEPHSVLVVFN